MSGPDNAPGSRSNLATNCDAHGLGQVLEMGVGERKHNAAGLVRTTDMTALEASAPVCELAGTARMTRQCFVKCIARTEPHCRQIGVNIWNRA